MSTAARNAISASALRPIVTAMVTPLAITTHRLADMVALRDHAGKGCWDNNASIPPIAWVYAVLFAFALLVLLPWLGRGAGM